ncbi:hypothetical protein TNCV_1751681 [Trichonephila clavipes]|nr:hypothetical protein TNCV_1751681 [Trichonephila clavipes]
MGRTILLERRQSESVGRRNSRTTFLRSDWPRPFARRENYGVVIRAEIVNNLTLWLKGMCLNTAKSMTLPEPLTRLRCVAVCGATNFAPEGRELAYAALARNGSTWHCANSHELRCSHQR